jgi:molecular chaperone GrpE
MEKKKKEQQNSSRKMKELEKKVQELAFAIDKVEDEKLEMENQLKKALADYHNLVKNSEKRDELRFFQIKKSLCEEIIPSLDGIMMAKKASEDISLKEAEKSWFEGIIAILESINRSLEGIGLKQYVPNKGDVFNSEIHEAIATVEDGKKGEIYDVIQPGYVLNDSVIRPARVVVSK